MNPTYDSEITQRLNIPLIHTTSDMSFEKGYGLRLSETISERRSGAFRHKNTPAYNFYADTALCLGAGLL
jgi:hypothetical protein